MIIEIDIAPLSVITNQLEEMTIGILVIRIAELLSATVSDCFHRDCEQSTS